MPQQQQGGYGFLDTVRINEGDERCRAVFSGVCETDKRRAAALLNDPRLKFASLFVLAPEAARFGLERYMNPRNAVALGIIGGADGAGGQPGRSETERAALKWMLETGRADDGLSDGYERALEIAASVLIGAYRDADALSAVVDMIFERSRKGRNIHDLVWAAFQSRSPQALKLMAERLRSPEERDARLSCRLLGIEAPESRAADDYQSRYDAYLRWLGENDPFLYFTGEGLQYASRPAFCSVDLERKYLHRGAPGYVRQPVSPADAGEREALAAFAVLQPGEKELLSGYSHALHGKNPAEWRAWVRKPIKEQVQSAKTSGRSIDDYGIGKYV